MPIPALTRPAFLARPASLAAATLLAATALTACVSSDRSQSGAEGVEACPWEGDDSVTATVRIGWQRIPNGDLIVQDQRLLETCMPNATVTWTAYDSGADVIKAYSAGDLDLALIGNSPSTTAVSPPNNLDVDVVWVHDVIGAAESLVAHDDKVETLEDLEGGTIGVPEGSTAHYSLEQAILEAGLDPDRDFHLINLEPEAMPAAWKTGDVDAVWVWEPTQSQVIADGGHRVLTSADTAAAGFPTYDLGTASRSFVDAHPEFLAQWGRAQDHAVRLIKDDPAQAAEIIAAVLAIPAADVQEQFAGYEYLDAAEQAGPDFLGGGLADDLAQTASFLVEQGAIEGALEDGAYAEHVDAVAAEAAR